MPSNQASSNQARGETRELNILYRMSATLGRSLELAELLAAALRTIEELLGLGQTAIYLRDGDGAFSRTAHQGPDDAFPQTIEARADAGWYRTTVSDGRPWVSAEPDAPGPLADGQAFGTWALIPLRSRGRVRGLLLVLGGTSETFPSSLVELLATIGRDLGIAIENARLFELVQRGRNDWATTFDAVEEQLAIVGPELKIERANRSLVGELGKPMQEVIGRRCIELFPEICGDDCPHRRALKGARTEREVSSGGRLLRVVTYPVEGFGVVHVARDVTAERDRAEKLLQAEKLQTVSTVLAGVAHELNNPLTVVIAYADLLSKLEEAARFKDELQLILRSGLRCQAIVRNLLAFSETSEPEMVELDVGELVRETVPMFAYQMRDVRLEEELEPGLPPVSGDRNRLQVVLANLLSNAQNAVASSKEGGHVRIVTRKGEHGVEVAVEDDGPGIAAADLPQVFEPFFTTRSKGEGAGLGLSLALIIAREHGGDIVLKSEPGQGTEAILRLPATKPKRTRRTAPDPQPGSLAGRRILFVDDEPDVRSLVSSALEMFGAEVVTAASGAEALERVAADEPYDVLFTDLRMPGMGGDEIVEHLREQAPEMVEKVILTTGDVATPAADEAIRKTGRPFLAKPFNIRQLVAAIVALVGDKP